MSSGGHHVAGHLLRRRALEKHVWRRVVVGMVHSRVVAWVWGRGAAVTLTGVGEAHLIELGVKGFRLRVQVIGWLRLAGALDWLLRVFPLLSAPPSVRSWVVQDSAAIGMNERLTCVWVDQHTASRDP